MFDDIISSLLGLHGFVAYGLVFACALLEAPLFLGVILPGESVVILGGVLASEGNANVIGMAIIAASGAIIGDNLGYWMGKHFGPRLLDTRFGHWLKQRKDFRKGEDYLRDKGARAVFIGRLASGLRVVMPGLAGMAGLRYWRFVVADVLSCILWGVGFTALGFAAGAAWERAKDLAGAAGLTVLFLVILGFAVTWAQRWAARHQTRLRRISLGLQALPPIRWARAHFVPGPDALTQRFDPPAALGIRLGLGLVLVCALGIAFGLIFYRVLLGGGPVPVDQAVAAAIAGASEPWLVAVARVAASLAHPAVVVPVGMAVALLWRWRRGSWDALWLIAGGLVGALIVGVIVELVVQRPPPTAASTAPRFGFPAHLALRAALFDGILAYVAAKAWPRWKAQVRAWAIALLLTLLTSAGPLVLEASHLTDVLAGLGLGWLWLAVVASAFSLWRRERRNPLPKG